MFIFYFLFLFSRIGKTACLKCPTGTATDQSSQERCQVRKQRESECVCALCFFSFIPLLGCLDYLCVLFEFLVVIWFCRARLVCSLVCLFCFCAFAIN